MASAYNIAYSRIRRVISRQRKTEEPKEEGLDLRNLGLDIIPGNLRKIQNLTELHLSGNLLTHLPEWIGGITSLRFIDLRNNELAELPSWIRDTKAAQYTDHSENPEYFIDREERHWGLWLFKSLKESENPFFKIFISYSHEDARYVPTCRKWLEAWKKSPNMHIGFWSDEEIEAGTEWFEKIVENLKKANVVIYLVSIDFLVSEFIEKHEIEP